MRKFLLLLLVGALASSCVTTTKVYRDSSYKMNKREPVYIERADSSFIYSDAQLERLGDVVKAQPDKRVAAISRIDSAIFKQLTLLKYKPQLVSKGWRGESKGLLITWKDYWINESDPSFYRFWLKGMSLKDSTKSMVYEGAPNYSANKQKPDKDIRQAIMELLTPGIDQEPDETDYYVTTDQEIMPKSKYYLAVNFGLGKRFGNSYSDILPSEKNYKSGLNSGYSITGDAAYFFMPYYGVGVTVSDFRSNTKKGVTGTEPNSTPRYLSDKVSILYIGPSAYFRNLMFKGRMSSVLSISGGYLKYTDDQNIYQSNSFTNGYSNKLSSSGYGGKVGLSVEYLITPYIGCGMSAGLLFGRQSVKDELAPTDQQVQNLWMNSFTFGLGIRLYK